MGQKRTSLLCPGSFTTMLCTRRSGSWSMVSRHGCGLIIYTKLCTHPLPNGKEIRVKAGTQVIDRFWGHVRAYLKHAARRVGSCTLRRKIRSAAQWTYWHRGENLWRTRMTKKGVSYCHIATTHIADGSCTYVADLPLIHVQTKCRSWHLLLPCVNSSD